MATVAAAAPLPSKHPFQALVHESSKWGLADGSTGPSRGGQRSAAACSRHVVSASGRRQNSATDHHSPYHRPHHPARYRRPIPWHSPPRRCHCTCPPHPAGAARTLHCRSRSSRRPRGARRRAPEGITGAGAGGMLHAALPGWKTCKAEGEGVWHSWQPTRSVLTGTCHNTTHQQPVEPVAGQAAAVQLGRAAAAKQVAKHRHTCSRSRHGGSGQAGATSAEQATAAQPRIRWRGDGIHTIAPGAAAYHAITLPRTVVHAAALHARGAALDADAIAGAAADVAVLQDSAAALRKHLNGATCSLLHCSRESAGGVCLSTHKGGLVPTEVAACSPRKQVPPPHSSHSVPRGKPCPRGCRQHRTSTLLQ